MTMRKKDRHQPTMTVREALKRASSLFMEAKIADGAFLAELLLRHVLGWSRTELFARWDTPVPAEAWQRLQALIRRRIEGEPVQYLLGEQEFYGLSFRVNPSVLIPRPETEILVEEAAKRIRAVWGERPEGGTATWFAADIGTGSGAIAVALATLFPGLPILAVDLSPAALAVARENAARNGVAGQIDFLAGDLLQPLRERNEKVHVLLSNPPYIPTGEIAKLDVQVKAHEPRLALDGGEDGLACYRRIIADLPRVLQRPSVVAFEVGKGQARAVARLLRQGGAVRQVEIVKDLAGIERIVLGSDPGPAYKKREKLFAENPGSQGE
ncbi:peptide chain release factor N(5)-glutamine methyltransferase [Bacillaceae bacterium]